MIKSQNPQNYNFLQSTFNYNFFLQKILKLPSSKDWVWIDQEFTNKGGGAQSFERNVRIAN